MKKESDLISRQAAIDAVHEEFDECLVWDESGKRTADEVESILDRLPSAQPEIIHCKDCKHWEVEDSPTGYCLEIGDYGFDENHYCGFAKRKGESE